MQNIKFIICMLYTHWLALFHSLSKYAVEYTELLESVLEFKEWWGNFEVLAYKIKYHLRIHYLCKANYPAAFKRNSLLPPLIFFIY